MDKTENRKYVFYRNNKRYVKTMKIIPAVSINLTAKY